jgi:hypothetical protein
MQNWTASCAAAACRALDADVDPDSLGIEYEGQLRISWEAP